MSDEHGCLGTDRELKNTINTQDTGPDHPLNPRWLRLGANLGQAREAAAIAGLIRAFAEIDRIDHVHVESTEVAKQMIDAVDRKAVEIRQILIGCATSHKQARGGFVAADARQPLERTKDIARAEAGQRRHLFGLERDLAGFGRRAQHRRG